MAEKEAGEEAMEGKRVIGNKGRGGETRNESLERRRGGRRRNWVRKILR